MTGLKTTLLFAAGPLLHLHELSAFPPESRTSTGSAGIFLLLVSNYAGLQMRTDHLTHTYAPYTP